MNEFEWARKQGELATPNASKRESMIAKQRAVVEVDLSGPDGNAIALAGIVGDALKKVGWGKDGIYRIVRDMLSADYNHLLAVAEAYCDCRWENDPRRKSD